MSHVMLCVTQLVDTEAGAASFFLPMIRGHVSILMLTAAILHWESRTNNSETQPPTGFAEAVSDSLYMENASATVSDGDQIKPRW